MSIRIAKLKELFPNALEITLSRGTLQDDYDPPMFLDATFATRKEATQAIDETNEGRYHNEGGKHVVTWINQEA